MRTQIAIATFLAVGAGAAGVSALNMKGSDTLKVVSQTLLAAPRDCGGVNNTPSTPLPNGILYDGTGSGNGQAAMFANLQNIAPMSRPMNAGVCGANQATAEGIVFALDGISLVADKATFDASNGPKVFTCDPLVDASHPVGGGMAFNKIISPSGVNACSGENDTTLHQGAADAMCNTGAIQGEFCDLGAPAPGVRAGTCRYNLSSWKQVLRIIYFGQSSSAPGTLSNRNCTSPERKWLAAHFEDIMQTAPAGGTCSSTDGSLDNSGQTIGLRHAFRRNDESGTTDLFVSLLGVPGINQQNNVSPFCNVAAIGPQYFAAAPPDKECAADADCANGGGSPAQAGQCAVDATSSTGKRCSILLKSGQAAPTALETLPPPLRTGKINQLLTGVIQCLTLTSAGQNRGEYFTDFQDGDPIRRLCKGVGGTTVNQPSEDVCSARGDLGLVLPISDVPSDKVPVADSFPQQDCTAGAFLCAAAIKDSCDPAVDHFFKCPDGSDPNLASGQNFCNHGQCAYPAIKVVGQALNPRCVANANTKAPGAPNADGRVFNLTSWTTLGASYVKAKVARATGLVKTVGNNIGPDVDVSMVGAFYKIHSVHNLGATPLAGVCRADSSTANIGCLVHASPCSIGYAGNSAVDDVNNIALKVNNVDPLDTCVRNFLTLGTADAHTYQLSRKLYLNSLKGFETLAAGSAEQKMAVCYADSTVNGGAEIATRTTAGLGFISLPPTDAAQTANKAYCEDYPEVTNCGAGANNNACSNNADARIPSCQFGQDPVADSCHFGP